MSNSLMDLSTADFIPQQRPNFKIDCRVRSANPVQQPGSTIGRPSSLTDLAAWRSSSPLSVRIFRKFLEQITSMPCETSEKPASTWARIPSKAQVRQAAGQKPRQFMRRTIPSTRCPSHILHPARSDPSPPEGAPIVSLFGIPHGAGHAIPHQPRSLALRRCRASTKEHRRNPIQNDRKSGHIGSERQRRESTSPCTQGPPRRASG
jgi:hypothetical protein